VQVFNGLPVAAEAVPVPRARQDPLVLMARRVRQDLLVLMAQRVFLERPVFLARQASLERPAQRAFLV
jgi:hypothetical protein